MIRNMGGTILAVSVRPTRIYEQVSGIDWLARNGGLRSRVRRFESCWGRHRNHQRILALTRLDTTRDALLVPPPPARASRRPPGSVPV